MVYISYSEVSTWQICPRKWYYEYYLRLESVTSLPEPLAYGIYGHEWLAEYYRVLRDGGDTNIAIAMANQVIIKMFHECKINDLLSMHLQAIMAEYIEFHPISNVRILEVEKHLEAPLPDSNVGIHAYVDLIVEITKGSNAGLALIDHKFSNNFKSPVAIDMAGQIPKYVWLARENGYDIKHAYLNQLRYRRMDSTNPKYERFRRSSVPIDDARVKQAIKEHTISANQIALTASLDNVSVKECLTRALNPVYCEQCQFLTLCNPEFSGRNTDDARKAFYTVKKDDKYGAYSE